MDDLEARRILHEHRVLVDPSDRRSYLDIVRALGFVPVASNLEEAGEPAETSNGNLGDSQAPAGTTAHAAQEQTWQTLPRCRHHKYRNGFVNCACS